MFNMIRMDIYRMFRTKSLYIIWIFMTATILFSTYMSTLETNPAQNPSGAYQETDTAAEEQANIGFTVTLPTQPGEKITVFDEFYGNMQSKILAIFLVVFTVMFSTADVNSGFIKCIGGQVRNRGFLILSKAVSLTIYTILSMAVIIVVQIVSYFLIYGECIMGNMKNFGIYILCQTVLHIALLFICMAIAVLLRNNVISMAIVICLCINLMTVIYSAIQTGVQKMGFEHFNLVENTVSGKITMISTAPDAREILSVFLISAVYGIAFTALSVFTFKRRDL